MVDKNESIAGSRNCPIVLPEIAQCVILHTVHIHFPVQMVAGTAAGVSYISDDLSLLDLLPSSD
ncbi:hypothetical protein AGMMS49983_11140 [Clostridia bacterium]|nr:hypothetical protein AGMMS49983_11140 [Clostridia bacterium]